MFIMRNKFFIWVLLFILSISGVQAKEKEGSSVQKFLEGNELAVQRRMVDQRVMGQKGLVFKKETDSVADLMNSKLVDPFNNQVVSAKIDFSYLDDGIRDEDLEDVETADDIMLTYRDKVDGILSDMEQKTGVNEIDLINRLKVDRIMTSPNKYVVIQKKKYYEKDEIDIEFIKQYSKEEFRVSLEEIGIDAADKEEKVTMEEIKKEALEKYDEIFGSGQSIRKLVKIEKIASKSISLSINEKMYILKMKK